MDFLWDHSLLWASSCSELGTSTGSSVGCRHTAALPWPSSQATGEFQLWHLDHLVPLLHWPWCLQGHCSRILTPLSWLLLHSDFFPLLKLLSQRCHHRGSGLISNGTVLECSVWNRLRQTQQKLLASSLRSQPCNSPTTKTLLCQSLQYITSAQFSWNVYEIHKSLKNIPTLCFCKGKSEVQKFVDLNVSYLFTIAISFNCQAFAWF